MIPNCKPLVYGDFPPNDDLRQQIERARQRRNRYLMVRDMEFGQAKFWTDAELLTALRAVFQAIRCEHELMPEIHRPVLCATCQRAATEAFVAALEQG